MKHTLAVILSFTSIFTVANVTAEKIPVDSPRWQIKAKHHQFDTFKNQKSILLERGAMRLKDVLFADGTIEFDIAMQNKQGFSGVHFRIQESPAFSAEEFYIRHHLSGKPDATQYTPIFNRLNGWQLYHGPQYAFPFEFEENTWTHVKIVVSGSLADFYLGETDTPTYTVNLKSPNRWGELEIYSNFAPARIANINIEPNSGEKITGKPTAYPETPSGVISEWLISNTFNEQALHNKFELEGGFTVPLTWTELQSEEKGIANIARVSMFSPENNTVLAKTNIYSEEDKFQTINFGYSDKVKVYVNGTQLYQGNTRYRSRDYRYLGTIGYFDSVIAPLKKGDNEVVFAVTEAFGGWGVMARLAE